MNSSEKLDGGMSLTEQERKEYASRINSPFSMEIEVVRELKEYPQTPIAIGRVWSGRIKNGESVVVVSGNNNYDAMVFGIGMFNKILDKAEAGDACGIMMHGVGVDDLQKGSFIYKLSECSGSNTQIEVTDSEENKTMDGHDDQPAENEGSPIGGIIVGFLVLFTGLAAVLNIFTIIPHTKQGWLSLWFWIEMLISAIVATSCFYGFLIEMKKSIKKIRKRHKEL